VLRVLSLPRSRSARRRLTTEHVHHRAERGGRPGHRL